MATCSGKIGSPMLCRTCAMYEPAGGLLRPRPDLDVCPLRIPHPNTKPPSTLPGQALH